jgi:3-mercaptopyruvate sulfurtransferase SseA
MRLFLSFLMFAAIGILILTACNSAEKRTGSTAVSSASPVTPADGVRRVTVPELQGLLANNEAVVIDVRNDDSYNAGHIKGAKNIPVSETLNHINEFPKDKLIVTYCS